MTKAHDPDSAPLQRPNWTALLLAIWLALSFLALFFARDLQFAVAGWPFNYWLAAQGGVLVFIAIVALHVALMRSVGSEEDAEWPLSGSDDE